MKALACNFSHWLNMDKQLEELVYIWSKFQFAVKSSRKNKLCLCPVPESSWSRLHGDFARPINGQRYLILIDAYNKSTEEFAMNRTTASKTTASFRQIWCTRYFSLGKRQYIYLIRMFCLLQSFFLVRHANEFSLSYLLWLNCKINSFHSAFCWTFSYFLCVMTDY